MTGTGSDWVGIVMSTLTYVATKPAKRHIYLIHKHRQIYSEARGGIASPNIFDFEVCGLGKRKISEIIAT